MDTVDAAERSIGPDVVGIYLHGSLAMGSYYRPKSDLDVLVVVDRKLDVSERRDASRQFLDSFDCRPTAGGIEVSILRFRDVQNFKHPLPFEVHFSEKWAVRVRAGGAGPQGTDSELAAHCTVVTRHRL